MPDAFHAPKSKKSWIERQSTIRKGRAEEVKAWREKGEFEEET